ncbi:52193f30-ead5-4c28-89ef-7c627d989225 [Sclerotinia trifoliorum]|uniref:52193f30-ead5-4c28-89ef-7c627d989225 n=1 Tax=Sclerotinia trifoliorum TaxID=28548 RepID=A0A8H2VQ40_9HELO|nr:52193f30-ead5-4c28-89ef-7c627d989225 [Sclerotinia trifoliorum]
MKPSTSKSRKGNKQFVRVHSNGTITYKQNTPVQRKRAFPIQNKAKCGIPSRNSRAHLLNMPSEIRDEILSYLLTNPILGQGISVTMEAGPLRKGNREVTSPKYDLHPAVLRVCKQMYQEGLLYMLYECNTFIMDCTNWMYQDDTHVPVDGMYSYAPRWANTYYPITTALNVTPLNRYLEHLNVSPTNPVWVYEGNQYFNEQPTLRNLVGSQASYAKKWKVIVRGDSGTYSRRFGRFALQQFCHAVCQCPGLSLTFVVCTDKTSKKTKKTLYLDFDSELSFEEIFSPLQIFRNVKHVEFSEAHADVDQEVRGEDFPEALPVYFHEIFQVADAAASNLTSGKLVEKYTKLIKGSSPLINPLDLMCDDLVTYAKTFQRVPEFKKNMDLGTVFDEVLFQEDDTNTYKRPYDSAECLLRQAQAAALVNDSEKFKGFRKELLLEIKGERYKIIKNGRARFYKFIEQNRIFRGMLCSGEFHNDVYRCQEYTLDLSEDTALRRNWRISITEALIVLEDYASSFLRDTSNMNSKLRAGHRLYDPTHLYHALPREQLMRRIQDAYVSWDFSSFLQYYKEVVHDMDAQYIEILEARKNLFRWDTGPTLRGMEIVSGDENNFASREIEPIEWTMLNFNQNHELEKRAPAATKRQKRRSSRQW